MTKIAFGTALVALSLAGCGGGGTTQGNLNLEPTVRAFNAVSGVATSSFLLDDEPLASDVPYAGAQTGMKKVDAGDYDLSLVPQGYSIEADRRVFTPETDKDYATVGFGTVNYANELNKRPQLTQILLDRTLPNGNTARLIVFNGLVREAGFEPTAIDFQDGVNPQFPLNNIPYGAARGYQVDAGTLTFNVKQVDTDVVYATATPTLTSGGVYMVLVSGVVDEAGTYAPKITFLPIETR